MNKILLETSHLILRTPEIEDCSRLELFKEKNKEHFSRWASSTSEAKLSYDSIIKTWLQEMTEDRSVRFLVFKKEHPDAVIGLCNFTQIFRKAFHACYLGYQIDQDFEGQGMMFEALQEAIKFMFREKNLHRIMANYMPLNNRSAKLLQRLGFIIEGHAQKYLLINGEWEDHILTALTNKNWCSPS